MIETVLGGVVVALVSGILGNVIGDRSSVKKLFCDQLRSSCQALLIEKIDNLSDKVESLTRMVNDKLV